MKIQQDNGNLLIIPETAYEADTLQSLFNNKIITATYDNDRKYITITPQEQTKPLEKDLLQQFIAENILDS